VTARVANPAAESARTTRQEIARSTIWVAAALGVAQGFAYLVTVVAARALGPAQFGILAALLGLLLIGNVVALGLQAVIARILVSSSAAQQKGLAHDGLRNGAVLAIAVLLGTLAISPALVWLLNLPEWWPLLIAASALLPLTWIGAQLGIAQGRESFGRLAAIYAVVGVGRGIGGVAGALLGQSALSALLGILLGTLAGAAAGRLIIAPLTGTPSIRGHRLLRQVAHATHALLAVFLLTNVDVLLARALLDATQAGIYGVGAVIAKVAFWLPQFVGVIAFPRLADERRSRALRNSVLAVGGLGTIVVVVTAILPGLAVGIAGGPDYTELVPLAWLFALIGALFALAQVLVLSRVAVDDRGTVIAVWLAVVILIVLATAVLPHTIAGLATSAAIAGGVLAAVGVAQAIRSRSGP
jgi:O-antigen/teichoic acid export membrane protein